MVTSAPMPASGEVDDQGDGNDEQGHGNQEEMSTERNGWGHGRPPRSDHDTGARSPVSPSTIVRPSASQPGMGETNDHGPGPDRRRGGACLGSGECSAKHVR